MPETVIRSAEDEALAYIEPAVDRWDGLSDFIAEAMAGLKTTHRVLLEWTYWDRLSQRQVADKLGCGQSTVSRNLDTARRALEDAIASYEGPLPFVPSGGRPRRDSAATIKQVERVLRKRGLLGSVDPFRQH